MKLAVEFRIFRPLAIQLRTLSFQVSESSGSDEGDFLIHVSDFFFLRISMLQTRDVLG